MTRDEKVEEAKRLRAEGLLLREIAQRMDSKITTVDRWLNDPDLAKQRARRRTYGRCRECGTPTDGSNGPAAAPELCNACRFAQRHEDRKWTSESIIEAIHRWVEIYGWIPRTNDWNSGLAKNSPDAQERLARFYSGPYGRWPIYSEVVREFGTWRAAIRAAGYEPARPGQFHAPRKVAA